MKQALCILCFGLFVNSAYSAPVGSYRVIDAYCSNPSYAYSPDEQAYRDSLAETCVTKNPLSPPCFEDYYAFNKDKSGRMVTVSKDMPGVQCILTTSITLSEKADNQLEILFGASSSKSQSSDPNTSISCESGGNSGGSASYFYRTEGKFLLFTIPQEKECGEFIYKLKPVSEVP